MHSDETVLILDSEQSKKYITHVWLPKWDKNIYINMYFKRISCIACTLELINYWFFSIVPTEHFMNAEWFEQNRMLCTVNKTKSFVNRIKKSIEWNKTFCEQNDSWNEHSKEGGWTFPMFLYIYYLNFIFLNDHISVN